MSRKFFSVAISRLSCLFLFCALVLAFLGTSRGQTQAQCVDKEICIMSEPGRCLTIPCPDGQPSRPLPSPLPDLTPLPSPPPVVLPQLPTYGVIISEYRLRGPRGPLDEFVELYNSNDWPVTVTSPAGSPGWALAASDGIIRFIIPSGTVIPARGHYLGVNRLGSSLSQYPAGSTQATVNTDGDATYFLDIPDGAGLALFSIADPPYFAEGNRLDAVGYDTSPPLYREGAGFPAYGAEMFANLDYSFYRDLSSGAPKDTGNNLADFLGVDPTLYNTSAGQHLGAPGPQNLDSPVIPGSSAIQVSLVDPAVASTQAPNYVRDTASDPANNSTFGTLLLRRKITNISNKNITTLRFRVVDITTWPAPDLSVADLRVRNDWDDSSVTLSNGSTVKVWGTYMPTPSWQFYGGGFNNILSTGDVYPSQPLRPGQSIYVEFLLGVQQSGNYRFSISVEVNYNEPPETGTVDR